MRCILGHSEHWNFTLLLISIVEVLESSVRLQMAFFALHEVSSFYHFKIYVSVQCVIWELCSIFFTFHFKVYNWRWRGVPIQLLFFNWTGAMSRLVHFWCWYVETKLIAHSCRWSSFKDFVAMALSGVLTVGYFGVFCCFFIRRSGFSLLDQLWDGSPLFSPTLTVLLLPRRYIHYTSVFRLLDCGYAVDSLSVGFLNNFTTLRSSLQ